NTRRGRGRIRGLLCHTCNIALGHIERRYAMAISGRCQVPHARYPSQTELVLAALPALPGMRNPCSGVPPNGHAPRCRFSMTCRGPGPLRRGLSTLVPPEPPDGLADQGSGDAGDGGEPFSGLVAEGVLFGCELAGGVRVGWRAAGEQPDLGVADFEHGGAVA